MYIRNQNYSRFKDLKPGNLTSKSDCSGNFEGKILFMKLKVESRWISAGEAAQEEPLLPPDEPGAPENRPRARRGLRRGERELRQRAQTQRGHHGAQVRVEKRTSTQTTAMILRMRLPRSQREVGLSQLQPDGGDRAGDGGEGPASHRSYQAAEQQVGVCQWSRSSVILRVNVFSWFLQSGEWKQLVHGAQRGASDRLLRRPGLKMFKLNKELPPCLLHFSFKLITNKVDSSFQSFTFEES